MKAKTLIVAFAALLCGVSVNAATSMDMSAPAAKVKKVKLPKGKKIYTEKEWSQYDLNDINSEWNYHYMYCSPNICIFWQKEFGADPTQAPALDGNDMTFDPKALAEKLESFWNYYYDNLDFVVHGNTKAEEYRMNCYVKYDLDGTAYGGCVDDVIGGLWVSPKRLKDPELNVLAHELGHCFQIQSSCDGNGSGGGSLIENGAQWMLWQVNPNWQTSEKYHWEAWNGLTYKAFCSFENMYHSPYVLEYWAYKHGVKFVGQFFRGGQRGEDAVMEYKRMTGIDQTQFNDEMFDACRHFVNWDFERVWDESRPYANKIATTLTVFPDGWMRVVPGNCPENYGFNAISIAFPAKGGKVTVDFRGEAGLKGYSQTDVDLAGYRYGFVCVGPDGKSTYGEMHSENEGTMSYDVPAGAQYLWVVVMGAPTEHKASQWGFFGEEEEDGPKDGEGPKDGPKDDGEHHHHHHEEPKPEAQFPYSIRVRY